MPQRRLVDIFRPRIARIITNFRNSISARHSWIFVSFAGEPARGPVEQISIARSLNSRRIPQSAKHGGVAELADALDLGSSSFIGVQVRFLSPPSRFSPSQKGLKQFFALGLFSCFGVISGRSVAALSWRWFGVDSRRPSRFLFLMHTALETRNGMASNRSLWKLPHLVPIRGTKVQTLPQNQIRETSPAKQSKT